MLVLRQDSKRETAGWMKSAEVMNNEVMESNVMNSEVSTNVVSDDQMKSRLCLTVVS